MFVYQNDKLYVQSGDKLVWVEIHSDQTFTYIKGDFKIQPSARFLTSTEVDAKFRLNQMTIVKPKVIKEVVEKVEIKKVQPKPRAKAKPRTTKKTEVKKVESTNNTKKPSTRRVSK